MKLILDYMILDEIILINYLKVGLTVGLVGLRVGERVGNFVGLKN